MIPFLRKTSVLVMALLVTVFGGPALHAEPAQETAAPAGLEQQKGISLKEIAARRQKNTQPVAGMPAAAPDERDNPLSPVREDELKNLPFRVDAPLPSVDARREFDLLIQKGLHAGLRLYAELAQDHRERIKQIRSPEAAPAPVSDEARTDPAAVVKDAESSLRASHEQAQMDFKKALEQAREEHTAALKAAEETALNSPEESRLKELRTRLSELRKEEVAVKITVLKEKNAPSESSASGDARKKLRESVEQDSRVKELHRAIESILSQIKIVKDENHAGQKTAFEAKLNAIDEANKTLAGKREEAEALRKQAFAQAQRDFDAVKERIRGEKIEAARRHAEDRDQSASRETSLASRYQEDRSKVRAFISEHRARAKEIMESYRIDIMNLGSEGAQRQQAVASVRKTYQKRFEAFAGLCIKEAHELRIGLGIA